LILGVDYLGFLFLKMFILLVLGSFGLSFLGFFFFSLDEKKQKSSCCKASHCPAPAPDAAAWPRRARGERVGVFEC